MRDLSSDHREMLESRIDFTGKKVSFPNPAVVVSMASEYRVELRTVGDISVEILNNEWAIDCVDPTKPGAQFLERYCWTKLAAEASGYKTPPLFFAVSNRDALNVCLGPGIVAVVRSNTPRCTESVIYIAHPDTPVKGVVARSGVVELVESGKMVNVKTGERLKRGDAITVFRRADGTFWL